MSILSGVVPRAEVVGLLLLCMLAIFSGACYSNSGLEASESPTQTDEESLSERALRLHREVPLIDGHNDLPWQYRQRVNREFSKLDVSESQPQLMTDIPRLREGGLGAQFWSVYVDVGQDGADATRATLEQIDVVYELVRRYPDDLEIALTADDVERSFAAGKIPSLIGMEGGHSIDNSIATLRMFYRLGARYMTLTHSRNTPWADSSTDKPQSNGLSEFGSEVVREMNRMGMLVDLSHVSPATMHDVLEIVEAPVIFSHSSARALCDHPRNVPDEVLSKLPANGGVVMITFVPSFISEEVRLHGNKRDNERARLRRLTGATEATVVEGLGMWDEANPSPRATLSQVADHIDHVRQVAGIDSIGIGSDFDGISAVPVGLEDVSTYPALTEELLRRGYEDEDIRKILGNNVLRAMRGAEAAARRLQEQREPSERQLER